MPRNNERHEHRFPWSSGYEVIEAALERVGAAETEHPPTRGWGDGAGSTVSSITEGFQSRESIRLRPSLCTFQPLMTPSGVRIPSGVSVFWPPFEKLTHLCSCPSQADVPGFHSAWLMPVSPLALTMA